MSNLNQGVDRYLIDGCGRCEFYATPRCKVRKWSEELAILRSLALDYAVNEELKWGQPCYTYNGNNIFIISALKDSVVIGFFKGALMNDKDNLLISAGNNSQAVRQLRFKSVEEIIKTEKQIKQFILQAIEIEKAGKKIEFKKVNDYEIPEELDARFKINPELSKAFNALTPGRQKGYLIHFSSAKNSKTREARIKKYEQHILNGLGRGDLYKRK